eukprot:TRINITY_DN194_c0_g1_i1.p1 TRINITY_DN194_c0_g1~~TRINITY_DN194_c0_g1_i1.p1  ORF type:complete len:298 (-),score=61.66 TRINITY_DN194_c0_g1_i1:100-930(-)
MTTITAVNPPPANLIKPNMTLTGRSEYLKWVNDSLKMNLQKVEEMCTGTAYCQFMHVLFPESIVLKRVRWFANSDHQYMDNFKILQKAFAELQVKKLIPLERLVKGNFMENYDFLVWFKVFYDANFQEWPPGYDAKEIREAAIAARPSSTVPTKTPDTLHAPRNTPTRDQSNVSPLSAAVSSAESSLRNKMNETQQSLRQLQIENTKVTKERDELKAHLDFSYREVERVNYSLSAVREYCTENMEMQPEILKIILAISYQMPEGNQSADYNFDETH